MLKISQCDLTEHELDAVRRVMFENGYLGMSGETRAFESEIKDYLGNSDNHVVCVNTGTSALHLALQACGITHGTEVLVPTTTYVASFQAISATGATPISCDILGDTGHIDLDDAKMRITHKTKAIMPVHFAGHAGDMNALYDFAKTHNLRVIEDAAHAFGTTVNGKKIGSLGDIICFSFDGIKNITCGEGGAIVTQDTNIAKHCQDARLLGVEKDTEKRFNKQRSWDFDVHTQGWRYHMSDMNAAIGRVQLQRFPQMQLLRKKLIERYRTHLSKMDGVRILNLDYDHITAHIFCICVDSQYRDALRETLSKQAIETGIHYKPNHLLSKYKTDGAPLPVSETLWSEIITIPCHSKLSLENVDTICDHIGAFMASR